MDCVYGVKDQQLKKNFTAKNVSKRKESLLNMPENAEIWENILGRKKTDLYLKRIGVMKSEHYRTKT